MSNFRSLQGGLMSAHSEESIADRLRALGCDLSDRRNIVLVLHRLVAGLPGTRWQQAVDLAAGADDETLRDAIKSAGLMLEEPAQSLMLNGLTEAETTASASVAGLRQAPAAKERYYVLQDQVWQMEAELVRRRS